MVSSLSTFGYDPKSRSYRDRITWAQTPMAASVVLGSSTKLSHGSYRRMIDRREQGLYHSSVRAKWLRRKYPTFSSLFIDYGGPVWIEDVSISQPTVVLNTSKRIPSGTEVWASPVIGDSTHFQIYKDLANGKSLNRWLSLPGLTFSEMVSYGTTGIARSIPNIPSVSIFTILGELREGLFSLPGHQMIKLLKNSPKWANRVQLIAKGSGSEFLNWMFGLMPTISDGKDLLLINSDGVTKVREKLNRDLRATYRRNRTLKTDVTSIVTDSVGYCQQPPSGWMNPSSGKIHRVVTTSTRVWFTGAFSHSAWKPQIDAQIDRLLVSAEDLGVLPNPERVWQLIPYSWLADWFFNFGELLTNVSYLGHSGLTLLYGYVMSDVKRTTSVTWTGVINNIPVSSTTVVTERLRQRVKACPYGFGLKMRDLTPVQLAILASLGISRTKLRKSGTMS